MNFKKEGFKLKERFFSNEFWKKKLLIVFTERTIFSIKKTNELDENER